MDQEEKKKRLRKMLERIRGDHGGPSEESYSVQMTEATPSRVDRIDEGIERLDIDPDFSEAIVMVEERPVVFVRGNDYELLSAPWTALNDPAAKSTLRPLLGSVGRVEIPSNPQIPYAGTGFIVGRNLVITNRHVAGLFADGVGTSAVLRPGTPRIDFQREQPTEAPTSQLLITRVVMIHPYWDVAVLEVSGLSADRKVLELSVEPPEKLVGRDIVVVGYPARDARNDFAIQDRIFNHAYSVKRLAPGKIRARETIDSFGNCVSALVHDASTLGGNSGSAVIDLSTGRVIGLHFAGEYLHANYCVPMYELACDPRVTGLNFSGPRPAATSTTDAAWRGCESVVQHAASSPMASSSTTTIDIRITVNGNVVNTSIVSSTPSTITAGS